MESLPSFTFKSLLIFSLLKCSIAADTLTSTQQIRDGEILISSSQRFELGFFSPGNSKNRYIGIWYKKSPDAVVWVANRNNPLTDVYGVLAIDNTGNLVLLNQTKNIIWSSNVSRIIIAHPVAQLLDSGNLVLKDSSSGIYHWQSFDYPTDTLLPGMKLGWDFKNGHERHLTSWRSMDDPSSGEFTYQLDIHGLPKLLTTSGLVKKYRTGQWNGFFFGGVMMFRNSVFEPIVVTNEKESYFTYEPMNKSIISRLMMTQSGSLQRSMMYDGSNEWTILYSLPTDTCDNYGQCGANTICRSNSNTLCECLKGFIAKSDGDLDIQNWSGTTKCERKSPLCQGNEGFLKLKLIKLPDSEVRLNKTLTLEECERECLSNCSCSAYTNLNVKGEGNVCLMWFGDLIDMREQPEGLRGEDLYIRLSASELKLLQVKKRRQKVILGVSISIPSGVFILVLAICICWKKQTRKGNDTKDEEADIPLFDLDRIATATNNFSKANIIGEGGFGPVYKGRLLSGQEIAVKKLSKNSSQGIEEFRSEVVLIAKLQHRNLVGLVGTCMQGEERILIYEYMPNKSLDYFIFDHKRSTLIGWKERFNIILGIARGLLYLHQDSKLQIVHRDLKPSNILLDSNLKPKISDFGLARISGDDGKEEKTKRVVGTYGYMSPEYAIDGTFSVKSDVFSFGVILLEMVTGKRNRGFIHPNHHHNLLGHAWLMWNEGMALELIDEKLVDFCDESQVLRCVQVGLLCVQKHPEDRPQMSSIVFMLANEGAVLPQPKQPGFFVERSSGMDEKSGKEEYNTDNAVSTIVLEPR